MFVCGREFVFAWVWKSVFTCGWEFEVGRPDAEGAVFVCWTEGCVLDVGATEEPRLAREVGPAVFELVPVWKGLDICVSPEDVSVQNDVGS